MILYGGKHQLMMWQLVKAILTKGNLIMYINVKNKILHYRNSLTRQYINIDHKLVLARNF